MPSSSIIIPFRNLLSVLLFLPLVLSCRQDEPIPPVPPTPGKGETAQMTLSIRVPDFRAANTRGVYEDGITEITVLMFADEGGTEKVKAKYDIFGSSLHTPSGTQDTRVFSVPVTAGTYKRIALIANAQTELAGITAGSTYEDLKQVEVTGRFGQAGTGGTPSYIPMYGEHAPAGGIEMKAGVSQTIAQAIPLIRMLARVDIINPATSGAATVGEVYFVNSVGNGRVWVDLATYNTGAAQSGYMNPTLPGTLQKANASDPLLGVGSSSSPNVITYYLNEQPATSASLTTYNNNRPCIVMILLYQGRQYYYRLDYTWDGIKGGGASPYEKGKYMPILRNHRYIFTIKEVKGPGFLTMEDALNSPENFTNHNIVVVPIVIDEAFTDITFNESGQFIAVSRTAILLKGEHTTTSSENRFSVRTNYPGGWKLTTYQYDGTPLPASAWLTPSQTVGAANSTVEVQALTQGKGWKFGYFEVQAGRIQHRIDVILLGKLPLEYAAQYNLAGGYRYGSSFNRALNGDPWAGGQPVSLAPTSAQTDMYLRWATSHANDQSGYYNGFVCTGKYNNTYNPDTKNIMNDAFFTTGAGKDYHIPSYYELMSAFSYWTHARYGEACDFQDAPEAVKVGETLQTYSSDFYSTGNGICYALRFKKGTQHTSDEPTVPLAATSSMACAYRYKRIGAMTTYLNTTDLLEIQCVYVGNQSPLPDLKTKIAQESWWSAQPSGTVVTRTFPAAGYITEAKPSAVSGNYLRERGIYGYFWSSTLSENEYWLSHTMFDSRYTKTTSGGGTAMSCGFPIRLFSNE